MAVPFFKSLLESAELAYLRSFAEPESALDELLALAAQVEQRSRRRSEADQALRAARRIESNIASIFAALERYDEGLQRLARPLPGADALEEPQIERLAYFLHMAGRSAEAGAALADLVHDAPEPSYLTLAPLLFTFPRYHQYEPLAAWIAARRLPDAAEAWRAPDGVQFLYRIEAQLLVEQRLFERALVAYDKSVGRGPQSNPMPHGLQEDLVVLGQPTLSLRLLRGVKPGDDEKLWQALALRALGKQNEAFPILEQLIGCDEEDVDSYIVRDCVIASAYLPDAAERIDDLLQLLEPEWENAAPVRYAEGLLYLLADDVDSAGDAFEEAVDETRRHLEGRTLDRSYWYHITQLASAEQQAEVAKYFDPTWMPLRYL